MYQRHFPDRNTTGFSKPLKTGLQNAMQQYMAANVSAHQTVISRLRPEYLSGALQSTSAFEKADSAAPGLVPENGMCKWRSQS